MALTNKSIKSVQDEILLFRNDIVSAYSTSLDFVEEIKSNTEFMKYVNNTERGKAFFSKIQTLNSMIEEVRSASVDLVGLIVNYSNRQNQINDR